MVPILPLPIAAAPIVTPVDAAKANWAALYARVNARATPELLQKWLGVGPDQAQALMSELIKRNIIHAPVAGSAIAVQPMHPHGVVPGSGKMRSEIMRKAQQTIGDWIQAEPDAHPDETTQSDQDETA